MRPLDHAFIDAMRERLDLKGKVDKYNACMELLAAVALGEDDCSKLAVTAATAYVKGFEATAKKFIPDLKAIEISGNPDNPLRASLKVEYVDSKHPAAGKT